MRLVADSLRVAEQGRTEERFTVFDGRRRSPPRPLLPVALGALWLRKESRVARSASDSPSTPTPALDRAHEPGRSSSQLGEREAALRDLRAVAQISNVPAGTTDATCIIRALALLRASGEPRA